MKVLIIGNPNSPHVRDFILCISKHYVEVLNYRENPKISGKYDICHVHYVSDYAFKNLKAIKRHCKRIIVSVWGSDFYRVSDEKRAEQKVLYEEAEFITFANTESLRQFDEYYDYAFTGKLRNCTFGLAPLEFMNKSRSECREKLGIPFNAIVVSVGYNASEAQQHLAVLESLSKVMHKLPRNLFLVFPLTYGRKEEYLSKLKSEISKCGIRNLIIEEFMTPEQSATVCKACDILIQTQITDALSGSMLEHLYAGNTVITGSWLPYKMLDDMGIETVKVPSVEKVGETLVSVLERPLERNLWSRKAIYKKWSWGNAAERWLELYGGES